MNGGDDFTEELITPRRGLLHKSVVMSNDEEIREHLIFFDDVFIDERWFIPRSVIVIDSGVVSILASHLYNLYHGWCEYNDITRRLKPQRFYREITKYYGLVFVDKYPERVIINDHYETVTINELLGMESVIYKLVDLMKIDGVRRFLSDIFMIGETSIYQGLITILCNSAYISVKELYYIYCDSDRATYSNANFRASREQFCCELSKCTGLRYYRCFQIVSIGFYRDTIVVDLKKQINDISTSRLSQLMRH